MYTDNHQTSVSHPENNSARQVSPEQAKGLKNIHEKLSKQQKEILSQKQQKWNFDFSLGLPAEERSDEKDAN